MVVTARHFLPATVQLSTVIQSQNGSRELMQHVHRQAVSCRSAADVAYRVHSWHQLALDQTLCTITYPCWL